MNAEASLSVSIKLEGKKEPTHGRRTYFHTPQTCGKDSPEKSVRMAKREI